MARPTFEVTLIKKERLTPKVIELTFALSQSGFNFTAGQFVSIHFSWQNEALKRSYSISSAPEKCSFDPPQFSIAISLVPDGKASQCFNNAEIGAIFSISGPYGALILPDTIPFNIYFIATGTGVAPYRSMIPQLEKYLEHSKDYHLHIIMGVQHNSDIFYHNDFIHLAQKNKNANFTVCLSQENLEQTTAPSDYSIFNGRVTHYIKTLSHYDENSLFYLCGNPSMIDDGLLLLEAKGLPSKNIKREKYTFSR